MMRRKRPFPLSWTASLPLLNGGLAGMEVQDGLARGCDGPSRGEVSLTATYEETRDRIVNETPRGAIGGINELTSPAEQCTEWWSSAAVEKC
ncbi:hypothetical protein V8C35DRAFT_1315 [Trichoderma chlorosporum]